MRGRWIAGIGGFALLSGGASCSLDLAGLDVVGDDGGANADGLAPDAAVDSSIGDAINDNPFDVPQDIGPCLGASLALCDNDAGCGAGTKCTPFLPPSWQLVSLAAPTCGGAYPVPFTGVPVIAYTAPGASSCGCTGCTVASPGVCSATAAISTGAACGTAIASPPADNSCASGFTINLVAGDGIQAVQTATAPTCATPTQTKVIPTFDGGAQQICTSNATGLCDFHRFCAPSSGAPVCIARAGDQPCPAGFKVALATGATDTRDCTSCSCATTAGNCTGTLKLTTNNGCNQNVQTFKYDGGCVPGVVGSGWNHVNLGPGTPSGTCGLADAGAPVGSVAPTDPITVCCQN